MNSSKPPTKPIADLYPLSPMQQGMLFHTLLSPDAGMYLPQIDLTIEGELDSIALKQAWQQVVAQHPVLRTAFQWEKHDQPFQVVYQQVELPWQEQDWRELPPDSDRLETFLAADRQQGFDLKTAPLIRLTLIRVADTCYHLIWTQHHLILDGWSAGLVLSDVFQAYRHAPLPLRRPYRDYIAWWQQQNQSAAQTFWRTQMQGFTTPTLLPIGHPSPLTADPPAPNWTEQHLTLTDTTTAALKALAQQHQLTLNTLIQGAFALLLSRYTDQDDICFGATHAGRPATLAGAEAMIGLFINTLPVRVRIAGDVSPILWLQQLQAQQVEAMQHDCSLLDLQSWCNMPRGTPLFESLLVFENYPIDAELFQSDNALQITQVRSIEWTNVPITLLVSGSNRLLFRLKFDRHQFQSDAIDRFLTHLQTLLEGFVLQPNTSLVNLPLLMASELQQLAAWNTTQTEYPAQCLPDLFEAQVDRTPDAIAVCFADHQLTYRELNDRANQLAHHLQSLGVQPETVIGICIDRSLDLIIGLLAILKAGAAYLPLDPTLPPDRLSFMLTDAQALLVLTPTPPHP
ncbi:MAG: AMP-binding protein, partial [Cyanobacteria bacterium CRU_2_1]|nr:AMP-binding protein [Cyanobacteria bacterium CRU_2_1]